MLFVFAMFHSSKDSAYDVYHLTDQGMKVIGGCNPSQHALHHEHPTPDELYEVGLSKLYTES